jgi:hypothetical protein
MSALRASRAALRARTALKTPVQRRGYADAVADKIKLSLSLPHTVRLSPGNTAKLHVLFYGRSVVADNSVVHLQVSGCVSCLPIAIHDLQVNLSQRTG